MPAPSSASAAASTPSVVFGPFVLDLVGARLLRDGQALNIAPKPWAVLCFLAQRPGQLVTKDALLDAVWGHRFVSDSVLKVTINALRQVLGEDAREATWLHTVPRRGYRFHTDAQPAAQAQAGTAQAPLASDPTTPLRGRGNLPATAGDLLGRNQALQELRTVWVNHRLLTLTGPGGVGKTRLALAALDGAMPADGTWMVHLEDLSHPGSLCDAIARTIGLGDGAGSSPEALARALAPLRLWLLLDNAEHLIEGIGAQLVWLLRNTAHIKLLVTSQRALQLPEEQVWPVAPLDLPAVDADSAALRDNPAIALMVQLVQRQRPGWQPGTADLTELAATAHALDGMPLALELAAARVLLLGAAGVRERLGARLQMLTGGRSQGPRRQRTLRASLEWSVGLLPPLAAQALDHLAVFVGGFSAQAAQSVLARALPDADEWVILDTLKLLQEMALLSTPAEPPRPGAAFAEVPRMRLLDSVRLFGLERLAQSGELEGAHANHRAWALELFVSAEQAYLEMGVERWLTPLEGEVENLMAAVERGLLQLQAGTAGPADAVHRTLLQDLVSLLASATNFCLRCGLGSQLGQWRRRLQPWLQPDEPTLNAALEARWCLGGAMLGGQGQIAVRDALALGERAALLMAPGPRRQLALYVAGLFQLRLGQNDALRQTLDQMAKATTEGATVYVRRLLPMLQASLDQRDGRLAAYCQFWQNALDESRALGDRYECWRAAWGVGQALFLQGQLDAAIVVMDEAIDDIRAAGRLRTQAGFASQAVLVRLARDASDQTLQQLYEVVPLLRAQGMLFSALGDALAWVPLHQGRRDDALRIQAWSDQRVQAEKSVRSPMAQTLRDQFVEQAGPIPHDVAPARDDDDACRLVFGFTPI